MNPGSPNGEGFVSVVGNIYYTAAGAGATDYMLYMGAGSSKISANIYGDARNVYAGGNVSAYSHYLEGYIESNISAQPTIEILAAKQGKVFINAVVKNNNTNAASYGIKSATDNALVVMQNAVIITDALSNSVSAPTLAITSYTGSCANTALNVGSELVGNILVSASVTAMNFNP